MIEIPSFPCDAHPYLPHSQPMAFVDEIIGFGAGWVRTAVNVRPGRPFARADGMPCWVGMEYMAQSIAAYAGFDAAQRGESVRIGFLVSFRKLDFQLQKFDFGSRLEVDAREVSMVPDGLATFDCSIVRQGAQVAAARINVFQPPSLDTFLEQLT